MGKFRGWRAKINRAVVLLFAPSGSSLKDGSAASRIPSPSNAISTHSWLTSSRFRGH